MPPADRQLRCQALLTITLRLCLPYSAEQRGAGVAGCSCAAGGGGRGHRLLGGHPASPRRRRAGVRPEPSQCRDSGGERVPRAPAAIHRCAARWAEGACAGHPTVTRDVVDCQQMITNGSITARCDELLQHAIQRFVNACRSFKMLTHKPHVHRRLQSGAGRCSCAIRRRVIPWQ